LAAVPQNTARVALCLGAHRPSPEAAGDRRFADDAWSQNPAFFTLLEYYFATRAFALDLVGAAEVDEVTAAKARQFTELVFDAAAPTNTALTNPAVLARTFQTGGTSLVRGAGYMVSD